MKPRPMYWLLRREVWEHRGICLAPLVIAGLMVLLFLIAALDPTQRSRPLWLLAPAQQHAAMRIAYDIAAKMIMLTAFIVGVSYCVDALHGERRDRSILFWKSLPVSDFTTVLSKASIPLVILPLLAFAVIFVTDLAILLLGTAFLLLGGLGPTALWSPLQFPSPVALAAIPIASALWFAPLYGWLLLVSGWARRAPFLWAVLPWLALGMVEQFALHTTIVASMLAHSGLPWFGQAFHHEPQFTIPGAPMVSLTPEMFLSMPGLWLGLAFTVACVTAAVRMRRRSVPI